MKTIQMDRTMFLEKVTDYRNEPKVWKYLGDKPCIVDFYADWCGPCKMVAPVLEEIAQEYDGKIYVYKVDTEKEEELSDIFSIRTIPSILFVPMSGQPQMTQGALSKTTFIEAIESILKVKK